MHFLGYASDKITGRGQQMIDVQLISSQIKHNCNISDARYWGSYSLCGLLLRLRELYRAESGVGLWEKIQQKEIGEWIAKRESLWKELEDENFRDISRQRKCLRALRGGEDQCSTGEGRTCLRRGFRLPYETLFLSGGHNIKGKCRRI